MNKLCGLIPAAGIGSRIYPYSRKMPKCMLDLDGEPNILKNILIMRDSLKISEIFIVIGHHGHIIEDTFGSGTQLDVNITYIYNDNIDKGLAYSVLLGQKHINDYFVLMLSDECYIDSNHSDLLSFPYRDAFATITIMETSNTEAIKQNYAVILKGQRVSNLVEKPKEIKNNLLGCGTIIFHPKIFDFLKDSFQNAMDKSIDLITLLNTLCNKKEVIKYFKLTGEYININDKDALHLARYHLQNKVKKSTGQFNIK